MSKHYEMGNQGMALLMREKICTFKYLFIIVAIYSCSNGNDVRKDLSGDYWYKDLGGNYSLIASKNITYRNKIYPSVTDYSFDKHFIIAEQKPDTESYIWSLGEDLTRRFESYAFYIKDTNIIREASYRKLNGIVQKDSSLYKMFQAYGASNDESNNRGIAVQIATNFVNNDEATKKIFSNKTNYWIIDVTLDTLIGPLTRDEYLQKKIALSIPGELKFEK